MKYLNLPVLALLVACQSMGGSGAGKGSAGVMGEDGLVWTSRAYPTGQRKTSAILVERGMPAEVQRGQRYEYEIRVTNLTDMVLVNVNLTDTAPEGFEVPEGAPAAEMADGVAHWAIGELEGGASTTVKASAMASTPGAYRHIAKVSYEAPLAGTTTIVQPMLELQRMAPEMVVQVDGITVDYVVTNAGTGTAREVVVEETLPEGFTAEDGTNAIRIEVGALGAGESRTVSRTITPAQAGPFEGSAQATGFGGLSAQTDKSVVRVTMPALRATVAAPERAAIGQVYTIAVTLGNDGDGPARDAKASLMLPAGAELVETDGAADAVTTTPGKLVWNAGTIEPGVEHKLAVRLRAGGAEALSFEGSVAAHGCAEIPLKADVTQYGIATVDIEVRDEVDPLQKGSQAVYLVTVRNQGTAAATNLKLVCQLEEGLTFVEAGGSSAGTAAEGAVTFEPVAELPAQSTLSWRVVVTGEKAGDQRFRVELTADQLDRPVEASESTRFFE